MLERLAALLPGALVVNIWRMLPKNGQVMRLLAWHGNTRFIAGVVGLIYAKNGDLLILKHTYKSVPWGLPAGALKKEQPADGLKREIFEETGFTVDQAEVLDAVFSDKPPEIQLVIKARLVGGLFVPSPEVSEFMFIKPPEGVERLPKAQRALLKKYL